MIKIGLNKVSLTKIRRKAEECIDNSYYNNGIGYPYRGYEALWYTMDHFDFHTVLDVGCGEGVHSNVFLEAGKIVSGIDYGESPYFKRMNIESGFNCIISDFMSYNFQKKYDLVWCCHVLEHQLNPHDFLVKLVGLVKNGGVLAITVPPYKPTIVGGHINFWNAGLLLYRLVLAGMDCTDAHIKTYDYDVSVIVQKKRSINVMDKITYDMGDLRIIKSYLPSGLAFISNENDDPFYGNIDEYNW